MDRFRLLIEGVSYQEHVQPSGHPDRLPPGFTLHLAILHRDVKWVVEYETAVSKPTRRFFRFARFLLSSQVNSTAA